jgi:hypothetical protein
MEISFLNLVGTGWNKMFWFCKGERVSGIALNVHDHQVYPSKVYTCLSYLTYFTINATFEIECIVFCSSNVFSQGLHQSLRKYCKSDANSGKVHCLKRPLGKWICSIFNIRLKWRISVNKEMKMNLAKLAVSRTGKSAWIYRQLMYFSYINF